MIAHCCHSQTWNLKTNCADRWMNIESFFIRRTVVIEPIQDGGSAILPEFIRQPKGFDTAFRFVVDALGQHKRASGEDLYESLQDTSNLMVASSIGQEQNTVDDSDLTRLTKMSAKSYQICTTIRLSGRPCKRIQLCGHCKGTRIQLPKDAQNL